jgi:hypothetical protein
MKHFRALILAAFTLIATCAWAGSLTVPVPPPNGTDDTANIQNALDQCVTHGPGCTVQLAAGTYHTRQLVAYNFKGTFKGAGMDRTIIEDILYLPVTVDFGGEICLPNSDTCTWPCLITFVDGSFTISDLAIHIVAGPGEGTTPWPSIGNTLIWDAVRVMGQHPTNATFDRFAVEGQHIDTPEAAGYNLGNAILFTGELPRSPAYGDGYFLSGSYTVRNSSFKAVNDGAASDGFMTSAKITIGGAPGAGNHAEDVNNGAVVSTLQDSVVNISYNDFSGNFNAISVPQWAPWLWVPIARSRLLIHDNKLTGTGPWANGIFLYDTPGQAVMDAVIWNNDMRDAPWGIDAYNFKSAAFLQNIIKGIGGHAIALWGTTSSNLIGNDVSGFSPDGSDGSSQIHLGGGANQNIVVCSESSDKVMNEGASNVINGCETITPPAAAMSSDASVRTRPATGRSITTPFLK